jgi:hypothetical protein
MDVTIKNQCTNIELTSPVYFTKGVTRHMRLPQKVDSESRARTSFRTSMYRSTFGGFLLYHLRRKRGHKSDYLFDAGKDTSISTQLLAIWEFRIDRLYSYACLIKHKNTLVWSEDELERLYHVYDSQDYTDIVLNTGKWLLDGNTRLKTKCKASYKGDLKMNIKISEKKGQCQSQKPLWVDPSR